MADLEHGLMRLVVEATKACGSDVDCITRYVLDHMAAMQADDRERIEREVRAVLAFRPPGFGEDETPH